MQNQSISVGLNVPTVTDSLLLTMGLEQMVYGFLGAIILLYLARLVWTAVMLHFQRSLNLT